GVDHRSDIFSFGIVLYELLTGHPPFRAKTDLDTVHAILHDPMPPLPASVGSADDVERILERCLEKAPRDRYEGMRDLIVELRTARREFDSSALPGIAHSRPGTGNAASIVVLPFTNMSADQEQEYFCDGMAEELIHALARLPGLQVVSRTAAFQFKG